MKTLAFLTLTLLTRPVLAIEQELKDAIKMAARVTNVTEKSLYKILYVESSLNKKKRTNLNSNGTQDVGPFQINTVNANGICRSLNVRSFYGSALCAAKLIKLHKVFKGKDKQWLARYHSKTPKFKQIYFEKLEQAELYLIKNRIIAGI